MYLLSACLTISGSSSYCLAAAAQRQVILEWKCLPCRVGDQRCSVASCVGIEPSVQQGNKGMPLHSPFCGFHEPASVRGSYWNRFKCCCWFQCVPLKLLTVLRTLEAFDSIDSVIAVTQAVVFLLAGAAECRHNARLSADSHSCSPQTPVACIC